MVHAFVVGSGPNGLAAAAVLARAGLAVTVLEAQEKVGGGSRSAEMTLPGLIHDHCAAIHPLVRHNPLLRYLTSNDCAPLEWLYPSVQCAHPLIPPHTVTAHPVPVAVLCIRMSTRRLASSALHMIAPSGNVFSTL